MARLLASYYIYITPFPEELLPEPPVFFEKICQKAIVNKILVRHYSSRRGSSYAFASSKKGVQAVLIASSVTSLLVAADLSYATAFDQTPYLTRVHDRSKYGWHTSDRSARARMLILEGVGFDNSSFVKNGQLDIAKVHREYNY